MSLCCAGRHTYISIAGTRTNAEIGKQITLGRAKKVKGFAFYSYNSLQKGDRWTLLGNGAFRWKASVPVMPWKSGNIAQPLASRSSASLSRLFSTTDASDAFEVDELFKEFDEEPSAPPDGVESEP